MLSKDPDHPGPKQSYPINTLDLHDSGPRSASNARTLSSYGIAPKTDAKKSGSPLFFRTSSIQQAKRRLKSSHEHTSIKSQQLLSKTGENFLVQSQSLWPFTAATPEHDRSTNLNYLLNDNSNQTTHRASNPDEPVHRAKQNLTGRHVKKYNHPANPKNIKLSEVVAKPEGFSNSLEKILPDDLRRTDALRRLMPGSRNKHSHTRTNFNQTTQNYNSGKGASSTRMAQRPAHTSQESRTFAQPKASELKSNAQGQPGSPKTHQPADSDYIHMDHLAYRNYKYHKINEKSFITDVPFRKPPVYIFKNQKETIENAIQSLHLKKVYLRGESPENTSGKSNNRRSESIHDFEKTLETVKQQQLEDYSRSRAERKKKELEIQSLELNNVKKQPSASRTHSNNFYTLSTPQLHNRPITSGEDTVPSIRNFDYFRKTHMKEYGGSMSGENLRVKSSALKHKLLRQEFEYYSKLTQRHLEDINNNLQDQRLEAYSYEEYKVLKYKFKEGIVAKIFTESCDFFQTQQKFVVDRVLLVLGINPNNELEIVNWKQFSLFKRVLVNRDAPNNEIVEFIAKFFRVDEKEVITKAEFFRILRIVTSNVEDKGTGTNEILDNFCDNFYLTGIVKEDSEHVDFEKFKSVFCSMKMNILDLLDFIAGSF